MRAMQREVFVVAALRTAIGSFGAFAAQACAVTRELDLDPNKVNPNGSGISFGHPVGATGAVISTKVIHELHRTGGGYGLVLKCIWGRPGNAGPFSSTFAGRAPKGR